MDREHDRECQKGQINNNAPNKKWNDYQAHAGGQGSEVKFNLNAEAVTASARGSGRNKQGGSVSTFQGNKRCLLGNIDNVQHTNTNGDTTA